MREVNAWAADSARFEGAVGGLSSTALPHFACSFLKGLGYNCVLTSVRHGQNDGGLDGYAECESTGRGYEVHCSTTGGEGFKAKIIHDAAGTVYRILGGHESAGAFLFCTGNSGRAGINPLLIRREVLAPSLHEKFPEADISGIELHVYTSTRIAECMAREPVTFREALTVLGLTPCAPAVLTDESPAVWADGIVINQEVNAVRDATNALKKYSLPHPQDLEWPLLGDLLLKWQIVCAKNVLWPLAQAQQFGSDRGWQYGLLTAIANCAARLQVEAGDLACLTAAISSVSRVPLPDQRSPVQHAISGVLRHAMYPQGLVDGLLEDLDQLLLTLPNTDPFWEAFMLDVYLRSRCGYIVTGREAGRLLSEVWHRASSGGRHAILLEAGEGAVSPLDLARRLRSLPALAQYCGAMASRCRGPLEARWVLVCYMRAASLLRGMDDAGSDALGIAALVGRMALPSRTCFVTFMCAEATIEAALEMPSVRALKSAEKCLMESSPKVSRHELVHLRLLYAVLALRALELGLYNDEEWFTTELGRAVREKTLGTAHRFFEAQDQPLGTLPDRPSQWKWSEVLWWLRKYVCALARAFVRPQVQRNPMVASRYRSLITCTDAYSIVRDSFIPAASVLAGAGSTPRVCAELCRSMQWFVNDVTAGTAATLAATAVENDDCTCFRYSTAIAHCLYAGYAYCPSTRPLATASLASLLAALHRVSPTPLLAWIYCAAPTFAVSKIEQAFVTEFADACTILPVASDPGDIPTADIRPVLDRHLIAGSALAAAMDRLWGQSEAWNALGTLVADHIAHPPQNTRSHQLLAATLQFYRWAILKAKERGQMTRKYAYNHVRVLGRLVETDGVSSLSGHAVEALAFLRSREAKHFTHKRNASVRLLTYLATHPDDLPPEMLRDLEAVGHNLEWAVGRVPELMDLFPSLRPEEKNA